MLKRGTPFVQESADVTYTVARLRAKLTEESCWGYRTEEGTCTSHFMLSCVGWT